MGEPRYPLEPLFGRILSPFEQFLRRTTAGGIVLIGTTILALALATAVGDERVHGFWAQPLSIRFGLFTFEASWHAWVNDALMALFFLLVGLELKREILVGELSSLKDAALPVFAAAGGMAVPAAIFAAFNAGTPYAAGWGIPMATDIAFAVGILVLLSWRIPRNLVIFLTALAIADDLGAVLVIAIFYTADFDAGALAAAGAVLGMLVLLNRGGVRHPLPYALLGIVLWYAVHASGIHATIAGVLLAATIPARPARTPAQFLKRMGELRDEFGADLRDRETTQDPLTNNRMASIASAMGECAVEVQSPLQRVEHAITPWVTFVVIPIFALANAGIDVGAIRLGEALSQPLTLGVMAGLVVGKFVGISGASWIAVRLGLGRLPPGVAWRHLLGAAWLGGIGFTMSLFIAQLAFHDAAAIEAAKLGVLLASLVAAAIGLSWLYWSARGVARTQA